MNQQPHTQGPMVAEKQSVAGAQAYPNGVPSNGAPHPHSHGAGKRGEWSFGLFDCCSPFGTCCLSFWCPCILYGKTHAREHGDPDSSGVNSSCCAWYMLSCFAAQGILQCMTRGSMRERHGIEGGGCGDFWTSCCCTCCTLIQEEKESIVRNTGIDPKTEQPYVSPGQMNYP
ncbi:hypothetical protein PV05_09064 [Exophiala xenobiotica]|uniref:Uncharacterized protein n=1 Tax=Exophiala xenobiotica TaxID=348802 RepID=A0A0D2EFX6_9EURO|nr:uncharacterized protein PV05_09064 [Exophiala xenobiotica]KIW53495.1 hypothetical protein PV05_09064 [Exophiala xenobiotica]